MSSTGRGQKIDPSGMDDYPTPAWVVHRLLEWWTPRPGVWVEPCAGTGALVRSVNSCIPGHTPAWRTYEVNPDKVAEFDRLMKGHPRVCCADFLDTPSNIVDRENCTAVITNPPFLKAVAFILKCRELYPNAEVLMLLRVGLMESDSRAEFWRSVGTPDLGVLPNRPSFQNTATGALRTDSTVYSWFVWPPATEPPRSEGTVKLLNQTSLDDRKLWR